MIDITMFSGEKNEFASCKAMGHSEFAKQGCDIVCSAVSVLLRTAVLSLEERTKLDENLKVELSYPGRGDVEINILEYGVSSFDYLVFLFGFLKLGLMSLSAEYPEFVCLKCLKL